MNISTDTLIEIASYFNAKDLCSFRLINRQCAKVGILLIARNLSVLNTLTELNDIRQLLQCRTIATSVKQLTISHGNWPVCTRKEWEVHPLLCSGRARYQRSHSGKADGAFTAYSNFIAEEQTRTPCDDIDAFFEILSLLSNLQAIVITSMQIWSWHPSRNTKYWKLMQKIWISPRVNDNVTPAVQTFLSAFNNKFPNITCLNIHGNFNPVGLNLQPGLKFLSIYRLSITSLQVQQNKDIIQKSLLLFPNVVDLSITFIGWDQSIPDIVGKLSWPYLKKLRLDELWASEDEIFSIFKHHQYNLERFNLGNTTIMQGSWRSLFTRIRSLMPTGEVIADGELYGRRQRDTLNMNHAAITDLIHFMKDKQAPWPF